MAAIGEAISGLGSGNRRRHTFGANLNWPPKGDPDNGSRVVSEKSYT